MNADESAEIIDTPTNLPESFWSSRSALAHIRQAAHARTLSADSVFGCVLARVATLTPPTVQLPAIVGSPATLDVLIGIIAESGVGKSTSNDVAAELVPIDESDIDAHFVVGSGEGLIDAYLGIVEDGVSANGKPVKKVRAQVNRAVLAYVDEGQVLTDLQKRSGSTLMPVLRSAWSGQTLGQGNASAETNRRLKARAYRFACVVAAQPIHAAALLADAAGGTPQRILWLSASDPTIPDIDPAWPGPLAFTPPTAYTLASPMQFAAGITAEIKKRQKASSRGEQVNANPLDSHANLCRMKVAALLAILDGRLDVNDDDWKLAGTVMSTSHAVRTLVDMHAQLDARHREEAATGKAIRREVALTGSAESRALDRAARAIGKRAQRTNGEQLSRADLTRAIASRDRALIITDDAVGEALRHGWINQTGDTFTAGRQRLA